MIELKAHGNQRGRKCAVFKSVILLDLLAILDVSTLFKKIKERQRKKQTFKR